MASTNDAVVFILVVLFGFAVGVIVGTVVTLLMTEVVSNFENTRSWWARREHSKNIYELMEFEKEDGMESLSGVYPVAASDLSDLDSSMMATSDLSDVEGE